MKPHRIKMLPGIKHCIDAMRAAKSGKKTKVKTERKKTKY
jgi:hypothetical protein